MRRHFACLAVLLGVGVAVAHGAGQQTPDTVEAHVAAAKAAAQQNHAGLFTELCAEPVPAAGRGGRGGQPQGPPDPSRWHREPYKVFDNLYFLGMDDVGAWAVTTSDGIIIIDALYDYSVKDEIVDGLKKLGLNPATIKYVIVSHGHGDHSAGAGYLQNEFGARVILSAADWDLLDRTTGNTPKPRRDMVATDGQKLTLGDTTITMYVTPGHTPGTISFLIPVKDGGRPHLVAEWGGTAFNSQRTVDYFTTYANSAARFRSLVERAGADAVISNHSRYDGAGVKIAALKNRKPGDPHPFVIGTDAAKRYAQVAEECARAGLARLR